MVQKVTGFKAQDGKVFDTEAEAVSHEKVLLLGMAVGAALAALGFEGAAVVDNSGETSKQVDLQDFLLSNSEVIIDALTPPKKERKPRTPKEPVANTAPAEDAELMAKAEDELAKKLAENPLNAEDELAELLGTSEVSV